MRKSDVDELKTVFLRYCNFGTSRKNEEMDGAKFQKMFRDLELIDRRLKSTDIDLIYAKVKPKGSRKLSFEEFAWALQLAADKKGIDYSIIVEKAVALGGPIPNGTVAEPNRFHDDKSLYTGVYKQGGPSNVDFRLTLEMLIDRSAWDVKEKKGSKFEAGEKLWSMQTTEKYAKSMPRGRTWECSGSKTPGVRTPKFRSPEPSPVRSRSNPRPSVHASGSGSNTKLEYDNEEDDSVPMAQPLRKSCTERILSSINNSPSSPQPQQSHSSSNSVHNNSNNNSNNDNNLTQCNSSSPTILLPSTSSSNDFTEPRLDVNFHPEPDHASPPEHSSGSLSSLPTSLPSLPHSPSPSLLHPSVSMAKTPSSSLREAFERFSSFGSSSSKDKESNNLRMDGSQFVKLCRDAHLFSDAFTTTSADLIFSKIKKRCGNRRLGFFEFEQALQEIAKVKNVPISSVTEPILSCNGPVSSGTPIKMDGKFPQHLWISPNAGSGKKDDEPVSRVRNLAELVERKSGGFMRHGFNASSSHSASDMSSSSASSISDSKPGFRRKTIASGSLSKPRVELR